MEKENNEKPKKLTPEEIKEIKANKSVIASQIVIK